MRLGRPNERKIGLAADHEMARTARKVHDIDSVHKLALSQEDNPGTHSTQREIARELGIAQSSVNRIVRHDLRLKCLKHRATELTEANK